MKRPLSTAVVVACIMSAALGADKDQRTISPAKVLAEAVARAERRGWNRSTPPEQPQFTPTDVERERGFAVFTRNVNLRLYPESLPRTDERQGTLYLYGAPGETLSAQVAVRSLAALDAVTVRAIDLTGPDGARLSAERIRCRWVEYAPIRGGGRRRRGEIRRGRTCEVVPLRVRSLPLGGGLSLPADWTQAYWLTIDLPADLPAGRYDGGLEVRASGQGPVRVPVILTVLPIALSELKSQFRGAFLLLGGPPDGPDVHTEAQLKDLADRGIHGILWFWGHYGLAVRKVDGRLKLDFAHLDLYMDRVIKAGLKGPVVLCLGNDSRGHLEQAIGEIWDLPLRRQTPRPETARERLFAVATLDSPQLDALYIEAIRQLVDHARERKWPEIVLLPYDEPTERLQKEYAYRAALIKKHFPETRIYGVVMGDVPDLPWLAPPSDILVTNGNPSGVKAYADDHGKAFWTYGGRCQAAQPYGRARIEYGMRPWALGTQGHWFWAYNWRVGDPLDEFDGERGDASWVVAYPPEAQGEACLPSPAFEGMRAAVDDVRYAEALLTVLDDLPEEVAKPYRERLGQLRRTIKRLRWNVSADKPEPPKMTFPTGPTTGFDAYRLSIIRMILEAKSATATRPAPE